MPHQPQLLKEPNKNSVTNHTNLFEPDSVKTPPGTALTQLLPLLDTRKSRHADSKYETTQKFTYPNANTYTTAAHNLRT